MSDITDDDEQVIKHDFGYHKEKKGSESIDAGDGCVFAKEHLQSFVRRVEQLEEEKISIMSDIKSVYQEAKLEGFDISVLREVIRLRKQDKEEREKRDTLIDIYLGVLE